MKHIEKMIESIDEELDGAAEYAECYIKSNGEYLWETFLLPCSESSHRFRFYQGLDAEGFLLTSDGLSALLYEEDGQGAPACEKLYQWSKQMSEKDFQKITLEHFDVIFAKYSDDDKSLAIIRLDGPT